jgi:hypothetical protein
VSKAPDRSYLADAIHLMELTRLAEHEVPAAQATVDQGKAAVDLAKAELDKHQQWLDRHNELYTDSLRRFQRRLKRQAFISNCKQIALLPIKSFASAFGELTSYPWRYRERVKLQNRIRAMGDRSAGRA